MLASPGLLECDSHPQWLTHRSSSGQSKPKEPTHYNKQYTVCSQEDNTNSLALLSIQKSKNALHGDIFKSHFTLKTNQT